MGRTHPARSGRNDVIRWLNMRFMDRDGEILRKIYINDGVLAKRHIAGMFWFAKNPRAMEQRLKKLYIEKYIVWPSRLDYRTFPIPEPICWLGWKGALYIAGLNKIQLPSPKGENENQLRVFQKSLHDHGIRWVREPWWSLLRHNLTTVDFRLAMERSVGLYPSLILENWTPEGVFRCQMDIVKITIEKFGKLIQVDKGVRPDAYFEIVDESRRMAGEAHRARFLLEIDMGTHDNISFGQEKAAPGVAYIQSPAYKNRFGYNNGRWLVVTAGGERRMRKMMERTEQKIGEDSHFFFFTTLEHINAENLLTSPIWWQIGLDDPAPLMPKPLV